MIPFNKPYQTGKEINYIKDAIALGKISGNGKYTKLCQQFFEEKYGFKKTLLTTSCTDALEMAAILINIQEGDEVILPSYTFVSTANAFVLRGAKLIFADSRKDHPGIDEESLEDLITPKTKAIVPVHYAGVACDMDKIMKIANKYNLFVIEDAAHAIDSYFIGKDGIKKPLGSIGHLAAFSFHETKNVISGEGGLLVINDNRFFERSEIIWDKGTNRNAFFRGEVENYGWKDIGSSFLPSEIMAAYLWAQLENLDYIQKRRKVIWEWYDKYTQEIWGREYNFITPIIPQHSTNNANMYYLVFENNSYRSQFIKHLNSYNVHPAFHYLCLHQSEFYAEKHDNRHLVNAEKFTNLLVRLPFYVGIDLNFILNTYKPTAHFS